MSVLSENIRIMRMMRGLSQKQLGDLLHKSANAVSNWEKGTTSPDVDTLESLCKTLKVNPNQIYGWDSCQELDDFIASQHNMLKDIDELKRQRDELDLQIRTYAQQLRTRHIKPLYDEQGQKKPQEIS